MEAGFVSGGTKLSIPEGDNWFHLDDNTGTEKLFLVASKDEISGFTGKVGELERDGIDKIEDKFPDATIDTFTFFHK
jgi:hypothetical protein